MWRSVGVRRDGERLRAALADVGGDVVRASSAAEYRPDTALINFYDDAARMGMHQDKDEKVDEPVISLSIGDSCIFRFGNTNCAPGTCSSSAARPASPITASPKCFPVRPIRPVA